MPALLAYAIDDVSADISCFSLFSLFFFRRSFFDADMSIFFIYAAYVDV